MGAQRGGHKLQPHCEGRVMKNILKEAEKHRALGRRALAWRRRGRGHRVCVFCGRAGDV